MCGICGFTGEPDKAILERMKNTLIHRGPDEEGSYFGDGVNLGIRRLSIVDIETGHQPLHNENKTIWVVYNGEIYNFPELREELEAGGHRFYTHHSDGEVLAHLYEEYGEDFATKINGMFAVAIWDAPSGRLVLVRDRMGVKPLFYHLSGKEIIFASEIKAILAHPAYRRRINHQALFHYFTFKNVPAPMTAFEGIASLEPGQMLCWGKDGVRPRKWWALEFKEENRDEEELQERIAWLLEDATRLRMRSDAAFGAYLSGGLDSSSVVAMMCRHSSKPVKTFSLGYSDDFKNKQADIHFARRVSEYFGTEHYELIMSKSDLVSDIGEVVRAFDQPFSGTISTFFLTRLISRHVKVALSGDGADELFGSYLSHRLAQPLFLMKTGGRLAPVGCHDSDRAVIDRLYSETGGEEAQWRFKVYLFSDSEKEGLLSRDFLSRCTNPSYRLLQENLSRVTSQDPLNRILEMEWNTQLPDQVLAFVDFLSMAHSVEIRSPFLDYRLPPGVHHRRDGVE